MKMRKLESEEDFSMELERSFIREKKSKGSRFKRIASAPFRSAAGRISEANERRSRRRALIKEAEKKYEREIIERATRKKLERKYDINKKARKTSNRINQKATKRSRAFERFERRQELDQIREKERRKKAALKAVFG